MLQRSLQPIIPASTSPAPQSTFQNILQYLQPSPPPPPTSPYIPLLPAPPPYIPPSAPPSPQTHVFSVKNPFPMIHQPQSENPNKHITPYISPKPTHVFSVKNPILIHQPQSENPVRHIPAQEPSYTTKLINAVTLAGIPIATAGLATAGLYHVAKRYINSAPAYTGPTEDEVMDYNASRAHRISQLEEIANMGTAKQYRDIRGELLKMGIEAPKKLTDTVRSKVISALSTEIRKYNKERGWDMSETRAEMMTGKYSGKELPKFTEEDAMRERLETLTNT